MNNDRKHTFAVMEKSISTRYFVILTSLSIELSFYDQKIIRIHSSEKNKTQPPTPWEGVGNLTIALLLLFMKMLQHTSCMSDIITTDHKKKVKSCHSHKYAQKSSVSI